MIRKEIKKLSDGQSLTFDENKNAMNLILEARASEPQIAAFLMALHMKGETIEEITGALMSAKEHAEALDYKADSFVTFSTGWDMSNSFSVSVGSAIVAAAGGVKVARYGYKSPIVKFGISEVIEALGININCSADESKAMLDNTGFCFLSAQKYHSSMRYTMPVRLEIATKTVFDIVGPLANPAFSEKQLVGVYDENFLKPMAQALINFGVRRGMTVHGLDGIDEITACSPTKICEITDGRIESYTIKPEDFGLISCSSGELAAGNKDECAAHIRDVFLGKEKGGRRNAICMNAGAVLYLGDKAESLAEGVAIAQKLIDSGEALEKLESIIEMSAQTSGA